MPVSVAFLAASLVLAVTPGPGVFYIVTRSASQGRAAGLASAVGIALGNLCNGLFASLGLATLFAVSALAFTLVKYAGACYLIYLGVRTILGGTVTASLREPPPPAVPLSRIFADGYLVALFNPKTAMFFAAFLPLFLDPPNATVTATLVLSVTFVLIAAVTDCGYALLASSARRWLVRRRGAVRAGRYITGGAFITLGLFAALTGRRASE